MKTKVRPWLNTFGKSIAAIVLCPIIIALNSSPSCGLPMSGMRCIPSIPSFLPQRTAKANEHIAQWLAVPDWLAGTWESKEQTIFASYNHRTKTSLPDLPQKIAISRSSKIGCQTDSQGTVWHAAAPYSKSIDTANYTEHHQIEEISIVSSSPNSLVIRSLDKVSRRSKLNNEEIDVFKEETITAYAPISDGIIKVDFSISDSDMDGNLLYSSKASSVQYRTSAFKRVDRDNRGNLRQMFRQCLLESGLEKLIPREPL